MTSFALAFMFVSMGLVTLLATFCLVRILKSPPRTEGDD
jgi:hypothetical protein